ncbi:MAG: aldehyde dehydrogenase family protein, partial [Streptosporangiales bacterium]|nr:aldehyde dehydrogenase family protein [Streptosporangiales bacterium]
LKEAARLMRARQDELARTVTLESGKPLAEARGEVGVAAHFLEWNAEEGRRAYGRTIPSPAPDRRYLTVVQPVGVVAAITPWNFPALMVTRKVGAALAAGCTVVLRPAPTTPLTALAIGEILTAAGLPEHVLEIVTNGDSAGAGRVLAQHSLISKITFTGSTAVGVSLAELAAVGLKRVSMELGGHAPFVVFPDADLDAVADAVIASRYRNGGQSCISTNRLFLHNDVARPVLDDLTERVAALRVGDGLDPQTRIGPLIDEAAVQRLLGLQRDAVERGATTLVGGGRAHPDGLPGTFFQPTVVTDVAPQARMLHEETFGPLLSVTRFRDEDEVLGYANATKYGLAAYVFTTDLGRALRMTERLDFGVVGVNDPAPSAACLPSGGVKMSGVGRECGSDGLLAFTETKAVSLGLPAAG